MERNFDVSPTLFRLAQGTSPQDSQNIELVKRVYKTATGAENVKVGFHNGPDGNPLIDKYNITLEFPRYLEAGEYVSLRKKGALQGEAADLIGKIIKSLASNQDAKPDIEKLLQVAGSGSEDSEGEESKGLGLDSDAKPGQNGKPGGGGFPSGDSKPSGAPTPGASQEKKPRMPFASKDTKLSRAMLLETKLRIPLKEGIKVATSVKTKNFRDFVNRVVATHVELEVEPLDAIEIVKIADSSSTWAEYHRKISKVVLDENDQLLQPKEYHNIAKIAKGEQPAPLA